MRIINNPNPTEEVIRTCDKCQCEFAFTKADIHTSSWSNGVLGPGHSYWERHTVYCPNCGNGSDASKEYALLSNAELLKRV